MQITDSEFIERLKEGNKTCFTFLFNRYYSGLVVYARHLMESEEFAEDLVHDVFTSLWDHRSSLTINISIKQYLFKAVRNRCLNYLDHLQVKSDYQKNILQKGDVTGTLTWEFYIETELNAIIEQAIEKLPPQCKKIFLMNRFEDKTAKEIGEELSISHRTVEKHIEKALNILRNELKDYLPAYLLVWLLNY